MHLVCPMLAVQSRYDKSVGAIDQLGRRRRYCRRRDIPGIDVDVAGAVRKAQADIAPATNQAFKELLRRARPQRDAVKGFSRTNFRIPFPAIGIYQVRLNPTFSRSSTIIYPARTQAPSIGMVMLQ